MNTSQTLKAAEVAISDILRSVEQSTGMLCTLETSVQVLLDGNYYAVRHTIVLRDRANPWPQG